MEQTAQHRERVIRFFDHCAERWNGCGVHDENKLHDLLDAAGVTQGVSVLDVACGAGRLFPLYFARGVGRLVAVDISLAMVRRAEAVGGKRVQMLCADAASVDYAQKFDRIVIFNALPHFDAPAQLFAHLADYLLPNGRLSVIHDMGRDALNAFHAGSAPEVSDALPPAEELAVLLGEYLTVDTVLSREDRYLVSGVLPSV